MEFQDFFVILGLGACTIIVSILAWTVREVVSLTRSVSKLQVVIDELGIRVERAEKTMDSRSDSLTKFETQLAVLEERSKNTLDALNDIKLEIKSAIRGRSQ